MFVAAVGLSRVLAGSEGQATPPTHSTASCVDPLVDARTRGGDTGAPSLDEHVDLDGHAPIDRAIALPGTCGSGGCDYALYVMHAGCGVWVGSVRGRTVAPIRHTTHGLRDLAVVEYAGSCDVLEQRAVFDGRTYHAAPFQRCLCATPLPGETRFVCTPEH